MRHKKISRKKNNCALIGSQLLAAGINKTNVLARFSEKSPPTHFDPYQLKIIKIFKKSFNYYSLRAIFS